MRRSRISCHQMFGTTRRRDRDGYGRQQFVAALKERASYDQYRPEQLDSESRKFREAKGATHVDDPYAPDNHLDAWTVHRRAHRLRTWPREALWQQHRRVP